MPEKVDALSYDYVRYAMPSVGRYWIEVRIEGSQDGGLLLVTPTDLTRPRLVPSGSGQGQYDMVYTFSADGIEGDRYVFTVYEKGKYELIGIGRGERGEPFALMQTEPKLEPARRVARPRA